MTENIAAALEACKKIMICETFGVHTKSSGICRNCGYVYSGHYGLKKSDNVMISLFYRAINGKGIFKIINNVAVNETERAFPIHKYIELGDYLLSKVYPKTKNKERRRTILNVAYMFGAISVNDKRISYNDVFPRLFNGVALLTSRNAWDVGKREAFMYRKYDREQIDHVFDTEIPKDIFIVSGWDWYSLMGPMHEIDHNYMDYKLTQLLKTGQKEKLMKLLALFMDHFYTEIDSRFIPYIRPEALWNLDDAKNILPEFKEEILENIKMFPHESAGSELAKVVRFLWGVGKKPKSSPRLVTIKHSDMYPLGSKGIRYVEEI